MLNPEFWASTVKYWTPDATETFNRLDQGQIVIVGGPWGIGKSRLYSRALETICDSRDVKSTTTLRPYLDEPLRIFGYGRPKGMAEVLAREGGDEGRTMIQSQRLLVWIEEPVGIDEHGSIGNLAAWRSQRVSSGQDTYFVINDVGRTLDERQLRAYKIINSAKEPVVAVTHQELQVMHLPADVIIGALEPLGVRQDLLDFIADPINRAIRNPRLVGYLYSDFIAYLEGVSTDELPPALPKDLGELRKYLISKEDLETHTIGSQRAVTLFSLAMGGTAKDLVQMLYNLGMFEKSPAARQTAEEMLKSFDPPADIFGRGSREGNKYINQLMADLGKHNFLDLYFD